MPAYDTAFIKLENLAFGRIDMVDTLCTLVYIWQSSSLTEKEVLGMQSNTHVIESVESWLEQGESVWLCSVIETWGSSPMPAGTLMAYCPRFGLAGSLSGGCIEQDLLSKMDSGLLLKTANEDAYPLKMVYGASEEEQKRFMLPCGGQLHLFIEYLAPEDNVIAHFNQLRGRLDNRQLVARRVSVANGNLGLVTEEVKRGIRWLEDKEEDSAKAIIEHGLGPAYQMLLIGASEVARCVAQLAQPLDFNVAVWDHREEFIQNWQVEQVEVYSGSPEALIRDNFYDKNNAIIALAHDPRVDDFALVDALATQAFYIGAIGSKNTCDKRIQRLLNYVDEPASLDKMHSPVGVSIGSKTPYEIAISILAEVVRERRQLESGTY